MMELVADAPIFEPGAAGEAVVEQIEQLIDSESVPEEAVEEAAEEVASGGVAPTYDEAFPPLAGGAVGGMAGIPTSVYAKQAAARRPGPPAVKTSTITVLFHIEQAELQGGEHANVVKMVGAETGTLIELTKSRDGSVTVMVTGKTNKAHEAKLKLQRELQTNAKATISIPKEHHRFIIGKEREELKKIQNDTGTIIEMPRRESQSDEITIEGSKEGVEQAIHRIKLISTKQLNNYRDAVVIERKFYPWIKSERTSKENGWELIMIQAGDRGDRNGDKKGPKDGKQRQRWIWSGSIKTDNGCVIHVPPQKSNSEELIIVGEKDKVCQTIKQLQHLCSAMEEKFSNIQVEIRQSQHKYIERGQGLKDIFDETGVWVEIPTDGSQTLKLYGPENKLSEALSALFKKANSMKTADIDCPAWLLKFIIGKEGKNIKELVEKYPNSNINCQSEKNLVTLDAPVDEFEAALQEISGMVEELKNTHDMAVIQISNSIRPHLIGKKGANINKIKEDNKVNIRIPKDSDASQDIEIVGPPEGVKKAMATLLEQAAKIENETQVELKIEQKWHRMLIGEKGENIQKIRVKYPEVQVSFPRAEARKPDCDKVSVRGPKKEVDEVSKQLTRELKVIEEENFSMKVPILKHHHRYIIGKGGINIMKVKEETNTRIDLPKEDSDSDLIIITGRKGNVDEARKKLLALQAQLEGVYEEEVKIDPKLHNTLIGTKGKIIRNLIEESGSVQIRFPSADNPSEKVSIRGEKADVLRAKEKLLSLAHEKELESYCVEIPCRKDYHRFLIGKKGANVQKLKKEFGVNYIFPRPGDSDAEQDVIMIMGKKDLVDKAVANLKSCIAEMENTAEFEMQIDREYFKKLTNRSTIEQMTSELGGIKIVPRPSASCIKISGPKTCVEEAKSKLDAMLEDIKAQVEIEVEISREYHRDIIGPKGHNVRTVTSTYSVQVTFPPPPNRTPAPAAPAQAQEPIPQPTEGEEEPATENGHVTNGEEAPAEVDAPAAPDPQDLIKIVGRPEQCELAKEALLALIPVSETAEIPYEYHRMLIGRGGENIRELMNKYDVNIQVPGTSLKSNAIIVRGHKDKVAECKAALLEKNEVWDSEKEDRALKSYQLNLTVDHRHHSKIIGRRGAVINKIKDNHDVQIRMPDRNSNGDLDIITLIGYEKSCEAARDEIMKIVSELEQRISDTVEIDSRIHARLIGQRGKNIRKIMEKFGVDIKFSGGETGNTVTIEGNETNVDECKEHLLELAEEYMDAVLERAESQAEMSQYSRPAAPQQGFFVRDAPWQQQQQQQRPQVAPDTNDMSAFPGLGAPSAGPRAHSSATWTGKKTWR